MIVSLIIYLDCIVVKIRHDNQIYLALGFNSEGYMGIWIACVDGLKTILKKTCQKKLKKYSLLT